MDPSLGVRYHSDSGVLSLRILDASAFQEVPLRYVSSDGVVCVLAPAEPSPGWATILMVDRPTLYWRIGSLGYLGTARPIEDSRELDAVRLRFEAEHGESLVRRWFGARLHGFTLEAFGTDEADYPILVEKYFDALSESYDRIVRGNYLDAKLRSVAGVILSKAFRAGDLVLEIGAGTGLETLPLARRGIRIVATDISQGMLRKLMEKAKAEGLDDLVTTRHVAARHLATLLKEFGPSAFSGAFSNFGALNCERDIAGVPPILADLLRKGAPVVLSVWNRVCLFEIVVYSMIARPRRAFSRFHDPVPIGNSRFGLPTFAHSLGQFVRAFSPHFRLERILGLPVFTPPYDLAARLGWSEGLISILESVDERLAGHAPFNRVGDHFVVELLRR